jgi:hypothetical protein
MRGRQMANYTDDELIRLYSEYSEEYYAAGFMSPAPSILQSFMRWLERREEQPHERTWYETEFLEMLRPLFAGAGQSSGPPSDGGES